MELKISILAKNNEPWVKELKAMLSRVEDAEITVSGEVDTNANLVFVGADEVHRFETVSKKGQAVFLISESENEIPQAFVDEWVDDVLVYPFRVIEVIGKLSHYQRILEWEEVALLNESFSELMERLQGDLELANRIHKAQTPDRFPNLKGFTVKSRYLAGMRSGGDYLDIGESPKSMQISVLLTDASTYGLSSAFMGSLMKVASRINRDLARSSEATVKSIFEDLKIVLGKKDKLSLFYGVIDRRDLTMNYIRMGSTSVFRAPAGKPFEVLSGVRNPIDMETEVDDIVQAKVQLNADDRLVFVSDGFLEEVGSEEQFNLWLNEFREKDSQDVLNELVYRVKRELFESDEMPEQDCSALVVDVASNVVPLKKVS